VQYQFTQKRIKTRKSSYERVSATSERTIGITRRTSLDSSFHGWQFQHTRFCLISE
jgi:hypothetical protein